MNFARNTTSSRLFLAIFFSFLTVVGSGSVAIGDLLLAPNSVEGRRTVIDPNDAAENIRALTRENESADLLAKLGRDVTQNPRVPGPKNPDYLIDGHVFDNFAPSTGSARNIWSVLKGKVDSGQASRLVLNLDDSPVALDALRKQFADWPIEGLQDLIIIKGGKAFGL